MRLGRFAAAWSGGLVFFFGTLYVVAAQRMLAFAELTDLTPTAMTDVRVMYGAFELGPGIFCLASLWRRVWLEPALALATITFGCVAAVRLLGIWLDGTTNAYHLLAVTIEVATFALAGIAWRGLARASHRLA